MNANQLFIRISKILLYAIHNPKTEWHKFACVVYQDFKDTFVCYTQRCQRKYYLCDVVYQDFKDTFVCYTQLGRLIEIYKIVVYQDFNEQFVCKSTKNI